MEFLRQVLVFLHFIGLAVLLGAVVAQIGRERLQVTAGMLHGALLQLVTGVALVGVRQADDLPVDNAKITVKLIVLLVIIGTVLVARRKETTGAGPWATVGALTVLNIGLAVFWT